MQTENSAQYWIAQIFAEKNRTENSVSHSEGRMADGIYSVSFVIAFMR